MEVHTHTHTPTLECFGRGIASQKEQMKGTFQRPLKFDHVNVLPDFL